MTRAGRTRVTVDPYLWNERAVRGWLKGGFRPVEERGPDDEHLHPWLLMEFADRTRTAIVVYSQRL